MGRARGALIRSILVTLAVAAPAACGGPSGAAFCEFKCHCQEVCLSGTISLCKSRAIGDELAAEQVGCTNEYDALVKCHDDSAICVMGETITSCDPQQKLWDDCLAAGLSH